MTHEAQATMGKPRRAMWIAAAVLVLMVIAGGIVSMALWPNPKAGATVAAHTGAPTGPVTKTATITAYASALNGPLRNFGDAWDTYKEDCVVGESAVCGIEGLTVQATAQTIALTVKASENPSAPGYIGTPPGEIIALVADTQRDAQVVANDIGAEGVASNSLFLDAVTLGEDIDKWGPYL